VVVGDSTLYVSDKESGVQVLSISDPRHPRPEGSINTPGKANQVTLADTHAYVADDTKGLRILPAQCPCFARIQPRKAIPAPVALHVIPNPASGQVAIRLDAAGRGPVRADVYDTAGRLVCRFFDGVLNAGIHDLSWDGLNDSGRPVAPGIYLIRVSSAEGPRTGRVVILR
jgi:hypothetical protein